MAAKEVAQMHEVLGKQLRLAAARLECEVRAAAAATITKAAEIQARQARQAALTARQAERARIEAAHDRAVTFAEQRAAAAASARLLVGLPVTAGEQQLTEWRAVVAEMFMKLPDEALATIASFLCDVRDFGRLACVSKRFRERHLRHPTSGRILSVVEEGAWQAVLHHPRVLEAGGEEALDGSIDFVPPIRLLQRISAPHFTTSRRQMVLSEGGALASSPGVATGTSSSGDEAAVCDTPLLLCGVHRAEFRFENIDRHSTAYAGLVGSDYNVLDGEMLQYHSPKQTWVCELAPRAETRVVLEVDLNLGTLSLLDHHTSAIVSNDSLVDYVVRASATSDEGAAASATSRQILVRPGSQDRHPILSGTGPAYPLQPPLRWAAQVGYGTKVRISSPTQYTAYGSDENTPTGATAILESPVASNDDCSTDAADAAAAAAATTTTAAGAVDSSSGISGASVPITSVPVPVLALICSYLSACDLSRLACVSRRFTEPLAPKPTATSDSLATWSITQEGARLAALRHPALFGGGNGGVGAVFAQDLGMELRHGKGVPSAGPDRAESWIKLLRRLERGPGGA